VLEYVSTSCFGIPPGERIWLLVVTTKVGGSVFGNWLDVPVAASIGFSPPATSGQVVRIYADAGSTITVAAEVSGLAHGFSCSFNLMGQQSPGVT
jgi:hypothetical protein